MLNILNLVHENQIAPNYLSSLLLDHQWSFLTTSPFSHHPVILFISTNIKESQVKARVCVRMYRPRRRVNLCAHMHSWSRSGRRMSWEQLELAQVNRDGWWTRFHGPTRAKPTDQGRKWGNSRVKSGYSRILISGSLDKRMRRWINWNNNMWGKAFFCFETNTVKWIRRLSGSKFRVPRWSAYQYSTVIASWVSTTFSVELNESLWILETNWLIIFWLHQPLSW